MVIYQGFSSGHVPIQEMEDFYHIADDAIPSDRPYTWLMFVKSLDGRATFLEPGRAGGLEVALGHFKEEPLASQYPDIAEGARGDGRMLQYGWAVADGIMAASGILREEKGQEWAPWDPDIVEYRTKTGKFPVRAIVTGTGSLDLREKLFAPGRGYPTVIFTATEGERTLRAEDERLSKELGYHPLQQQVSVHAIDEGTKIQNWAEVMRILRQEHDVKRLDLQGGPELSTMIYNARLLDEYRFTIAPHIIGDTFQGRARPSPFKGLSLGPDESMLFPHIKPVRQIGGHVYYRTKPMYR